MNGWGKLVAGVGIPGAIAFYLVTQVAGAHDGKVDRLTESLTRQTAILEMICRSVAPNAFERAQCRAK